MRFIKQLKDLEKGGRTPQTVHRDEPRNFLMALFFIIVAFLALAISTGIEAGYTPVTNKCISCHNDTGYPADTDLDGVAAPYKRPHNNTVMCEYCHGSDLHNITFIQPDGTYGARATSATCPDCHVAGIPSANNTNFTMAPIIPDTLKHSSNISNGTVWGTYWLSSVGSCYYCHGDTKHNVTALGKISALLEDANNTRNGSLTTTNWCADCHYNGSVNTNYRGNATTIDGSAYLFIPTPPLITANNTGRSRWVNHSGYLTGGYRDSNCSSCHALNGTSIPTSLNYSHSLNEGSFPNCISCHYTGSASRNIDISAISASVHAGMNSNNATAAGVAAINGACWACHDSDGNVTNNPNNLMGDLYKTPKRCDDCHLSSGSYYSQATSWGAPLVGEHFFAGAKIKAGNSTSNISSCINCHENVNEMILNNSDTDYGSFAGDGVGLTGGNRSFYHYGKPRIELRIWDSGRADNCSYCHQNTSTAFNIGMTDPEYNSSIQNHSLNPSSPACYNSTCHNSGWLHNSTLSRPALPIPNSTYCQNCHVSKQKHNGTLDCSACHINGTSTDTIHPIKYVQTGTGSFATTNDQAANCAACHQTTLPGFSQASVIPGLKHSTDPYAGRKWGSYWDNTSIITACYYCHQNELHNSNSALLGNVSNIKGSNSFNNPDLANSTWCANCHYNDSSPNYKGYLIDPKPPEILNRSGEVPAIASDGTAFYNHSGIGNYKDSHCKNCHGGALSGYSATTLNFSHSISEGGGGPNCTSCHDTNGSGAPADRRIDASAMKQGVHKNLNRNATADKDIDQINKACWACHGEGDEPSGHPQRYKTPRKCSDSDCHSLSQSRYNETMIYSHFRNASLNSNPENATNYNVTTTVQCQSCHVNSLVKRDSNPELALVSHYGSRDDLVDSFNCRYCHLDKDNSKDWGSATLINENRTSLIELEKERNKLKVSEGEKLYLGEGYFLKLMEVSNNRDEALIQLLKGDTIVDEVSLGAGTQYKYEGEMVIDNSTSKIPVITLNITSIFRGQKQGFIQFEGSRIRKVHTDRESKNDSACYACHLYRYSGNKERYLVLDREYKENSSTIYYTRVLVDYSPENKSKIYFNDEEQVFRQLESNAAAFISNPSPQKYLKEGEAWNISDNYSLRLNEVSTDSKEAWLTLTIDNSIVEEELVIVGSEFKYAPGIRYKEDTETNVTVFTAKISAIAQGAPNFILLKDVMAVSPNIMKVASNTVLFGYNSSWLDPYDTFTVGRIPANLHSPNLYIDQGNWADCVRCHDTSRHLKIANIDAISSRLGKHAGLNMNASSRTILSDPIDRACWACHTEGTEPRIHSPTYIKPRACSSCHVYQEQPSYGAINISDDPHGNQTGCETCHTLGSHNIIRFQVSPVVKDVSLSRTTVLQGDKVRLIAMANAGYRMKIRAAEYYIDERGAPGKGTPLKPLDGAFASQREEITGEIDTGAIPIGEHLIYIHAMERNDRWGEFNPVNLTVVSEMSDLSNRAYMDNAKAGKRFAGIGIIALVISLIVAYLVFQGAGRR